MKMREKGPGNKVSSSLQRGLTGYYRSYSTCQHPEVANPLTDALLKQAPEKVVWDETKEKMFLRLKVALINPPVIRAPGFHKPFFVQCNTSNCGMGVILCQKDDDKQEHLMLYATHKLSITEEVHSTSEK